MRLLLARGLPKSQEQKQGNHIASVNNIGSLNMIASERLFNKTVQQLSSHTVKHVASYVQPD